jgi:hypothetical protein
MLTRIRRGVTATDDVLHVWGRRDSFRQSGDLSLGWRTERCVLFEGEMHESVEEKV